MHPHPPSSTHAKRLQRLAALLLVLAGCAPQQRPDYYEGKHLRHWEILAESDDPLQRKAAADALGKIGAHGVPALVKLRQDRDHRVETAAMLALIQLGPAVGAPLAEIMRTGEPQARLQAVRTAKFLGRSAVADAVPTITELAASDSSRAIRQTAAEALRVLRSKGKPVFKQEESPSPGR